MRIMLINPNRVQPPVMPIGMLYIASFLKKHGIDIAFLDLCFEEQPELLVERELKRYQPDAVGIGIRNIDSIVYTQMHFYLEGVLEITSRIKRMAPGLPIILGGAGYSIFPKEVLTLLQADYGIVGEGEKSFLLLCGIISCGQVAKHGVPGLVFWDDRGNVVMNPIKNMTVTELNELPLPDYSLIDVKRYYRQGGACSIQTKRGCALGCIYCTYPSIEGKCFRLRTPKKVVDEMEYMGKTFGMNYFYIVDSIFNVPFYHTECICDEIISRNLDIHWFAYLSPIGFTKQRLDKLIRSGADGIWLSVDTCSDEMLDNMGKGYDTGVLEHAVTICEERGISYNFVLLLGGPGETKQTLSETFDFLESHNPNIVVIMYGLRVYPGTPLYFSQLFKASPEELLNPLFYVSPPVTDNIYQLLKERTSGKAKWFLNSEHPDRKEQIQKLLMERKIKQCYENGMRGPYWAIVDKL